MVLMLDEPGRVGDGVVPRGGPVDHPLDLGVGGLQHAHGLPVQGGGEQVGGHVVRVVDGRASCIDATGGEQSDWVRGGGGLQDGAALGWPPSVLVASTAPRRVVAGTPGPVVVVQCGWGVGEDGQAPHQGLAVLDVDGRVEDAGHGDDRVEAVAAGEGVVDGGDQRRPPRAVLQVSCTLGPERRG